MMATKQIQAVVTGKVQGVGFRYFAVHAAQRLGLNGTVRNTAAGDVEVNASGDEIKLTEFIGELYEGPSAAEVTDVRVAWIPQEPAPAVDIPGFHAVS
jgi:acylphosphatase